MCNQFKAAQFFNLRKIYNLPGIKIDNYVNELFRKTNFNENIDCKLCTAPLLF